MANHYTDGKLDLSEILIKDIVADETTYYQYEIISPATSLFEVEEMFFRNLAVGRSQYLILLAEVDEIREWDDIKGIITPWDLPKVLNLVQFE